ncbi:hypothetical protein IC582_028172 [Cucumis melo]|uniref:RBR-type E3 ubiquitin transferase n=1 Tax=Cucumis melo TaxID=3656 RepID=A0A1S3CJH8_CUCME|nr:E3 ubiquitin-protein ligase RSL1-like [Cucumis melo]
MADTLNDDDCVQELITQQRSELLSAKTLFSDLDYAFQLQLQEAMDASLTSIPSIESSSSLNTADPVLDSEETSGLDLATTLMLEDIARFAMEFKDREHCQTEMRKMKEELDRRIHDQKFAEYIRSVPENEWREYGDNYEKPYGESSSSSSSSSSWNVDSECFRVYSKGLISEERIRDTVVRVAGIGIAVCDPKDNLLFEKMSPIESMVEGKETSNECAELEALVEGLNVALILGLKSITFFCADYMLYQYLTGRVPPATSSTAKLVNEVVVLQGKFTYCNPSLVTRNDIKFAFKLAREAIVSQITWPAEADNGNCLKETCTICFEDVSVDQMFSVDGCLHRYCFSCMKQHVEVKLLNGNGMQANCPYQGCTSEVNIESCGKFLEPKVFEIMSQRIKEASVPIQEKVYCPYSRCSALMSKTELLRYTEASYINAERTGARKCMKCNQFFCINCKVAWHYNLTCYDYRNLNPNLHPDEQMLKSLATRKLWRQCIVCNNMVELAEGCYHITCRCGYEFCYTCGAPWKNKKPTCKCPIWDERNIIHRR